MKIFTIGHSNLSYDEFRDRLVAIGITAIADVRSSPFSRAVPHFNRPELKAALKRDGLSYSFLGKELGGRPRNEIYYRDGIADYVRMATDETFVLGLNRVEEGSKSYNIAMMCSERSPLECHRCLLVGRALKERGCTVCNILFNQEIISQDDVEKQLLVLAKKSTQDMFIDSETQISDAYETQSRRFAYSKPSID